MKAWHMRSSLTAAASASARGAQRCAGHAVRLTAERPAS